MQLAEQDLEKALAGKRAVERAQRQRLGWIYATAASYAVDTLFLGIFAWLGTIPARVPLLYGAVAIGIFGLTYGATRTGWNLKRRDPGFTLPLLTIGVCQQLAIVAAAPQVAFPFLANLFTVFAFGMIWLSVRQSLVVWLVGVLGTAAVIFAADAPLGVPAASRLEVFLVWLYFSLILARTVVLSVNANEMRERLADSRRRLSVSLEQVRQLASHDELTRSLNRRSLMERLAQESDRAIRTGVPFSIALLDLDHFKQVNDTHGHGVGDEVLRSFAALAKDAMRVTDAFGRYGGEEFLLILIGTAPPAARDPMERVRRVVAERDWSSVAPGLRVTVSAGVAGFRNGESLEELLRRADEALYAAKREGRDRVVIDEG